MTNYTSDTYQNNNADIRAKYYAGKDLASTLSKLGSLLGRSSDSEVKKRLQNLVMQDRLQRETAQGIKEMFAIANELNEALTFISEGHGIIDSLYNAWNDVMDKMPGIEKLVSDMGLDVRGEGNAYFNETLKKLTLSPQEQQKRADAMLKVMRDLHDDIAIIGGYDRLVLG